MDTPITYTTAELQILFAEGPRAGLPDGRWVPARSERMGGLKLRIRLRAAWAVFTGRADALLWTGYEVK